MLTSKKILKKVQEKKWGGKTTEKYVSIDSSKRE
jgi:hypothetical protein